MRSFGTNSRGGFGSRSGGSRFGGGRGGFGDRDSGRFERRPAEMHDATCDKCKKRCQVPFRPSGDKPVFCSECFRNEGSDSSFGSRDRGRPERSSSSEMSSNQFKLINAKLDKIINVLSTLEIDSGEDSDEDLDDDGEEEDLEVGSGEDLSADSDKEKDSKDDLDEDSDDDLEDDSEDESKTA